MLIFIILFWGFFETTIANETGSECTGIQITSDTPNTKSGGIILSNHRLYTKECYEQVLEQVLSEPSKPFVLFVSGRGKHPYKELKENLLPTIEGEYDVTAIMFTWPSWCKADCFPEEAALNSGSELMEILLILQEIKDNNQDVRGYTLLTHSMGAIVLQGLVSEGQVNPLSEILFDNIIISAPAAQFKDHKQWVSKISFSRRIYITENNNDRSLKCLEGKASGPATLAFCKVFGNFDLPPRLGRWAVTSATLNNTADNTHYIGLTGAVKKKHRYYINQSKQAEKVFAFYRDVLRGEKASLNEFKETIEGRVFKIK